MTIKAIWVLAAGTVLAACQSAPQTPETTADIPADHRAKTVAMFHRQLKDPYSVRDAEISQPFMVFTSVIEGGNHPGYCVRFNSKNSFGAYGGSTTYPVWFSGAAQPGYFADDPLNRCAKATGWEPFPELMAKS